MIVGVKLRILQLSNCVVVVWRSPVLVVIVVGVVVGVFVDYLRVHVAVGCLRELSNGTVLTLPVEVNHARVGLGVETSVKFESAPATRHPSLYISDGVCTTSTGVILICKLLKLGKHLRTGHLVLVLDFFLEFEICILLLLHQFSLLLRVQPIQSPVYLFVVQVVLRGV